MKNCIHTLFLKVFILFLLPFNGYGQETLTREQEREIKTSGRYYFGECSTFGAETATECALMNLTQEILVDMVRQSIQSEIGFEEYEVKKVMEMQAKTALLSTTGRIRALAWVEKEKIATGISSASTPAPTSTPALTSSIADSVVRELATCETYGQFRRMADGFKRQGKLIYGTNKSSFGNPDKCLVAVFTSEQKLIALLDAGQNVRTDFLSGKTIQNVEQHFSGNTLFWIQINNNN